MAFERNLLGEGCCSHIVGSLKNRLHTSEVYRRIRCLLFLVEIPSQSPTRLCGSLSYDKHSSVLRSSPHS